MSIVPDPASYSSSLPGHFAPISDLGNRSEADGLFQVPSRSVTPAGSKPTLTVRNPTNSFDVEETQKQMGELEEKLRNSPGAKILENSPSASSSLMQKGMAVLGGAAPFAKVGALLTLFLYLNLASMGTVNIFIVVAAISGPTILVVSGSKLAEYIAEKVKANQEELEKKLKH